MGCSGKGLGSLKPVGFEPNPHAAMSSSDFTQRRRQGGHQGQAAARAEEVQHGSHGKEAGAETADEMLDRLLEDMNAPGKGQGQDHHTQPEDHRQQGTLVSGH